MTETLKIATLGNGLTVVTERNPASPLAAVNLWYNVGSRDEEIGQRGIAHLFEHLMFQGSRNVPSGEYSSALEQFGARFNATTSLERTNYFATVPVHALPLALWLEADRMGTLAEGLSLRELDAQREVVKQERLQTIVDVPYGRMFEYLLARLFPAPHPYSLGPIGLMEDLDAATLDVLRDFFATHYAPSNAVLSIVGDIDPDAALAEAERFFGGIPSLGSGAKTTSLPTLPPLDSSVAYTVGSAVPEVGITLAWRGPSGETDEAVALSVAVAVLGQGRNSRLRAKLIRETELAVDIGVGMLELAGNSIVISELYLAEDSNPGALLDIVESELSDLAQNGPREAEFDAAMAQLERSFDEVAATVAGRADALSRAATIYGDARQADAARERLLAVTPQRVADAVARWLRIDSSVRISFVPAEGADGDVELADDLLSAELATTEGAVR